MMGYCGIWVIRASGNLGCNGRPFFGGGRLLWIMMMLCCGACKMGYYDCV